MIQQSHKPTGNTDRERWENVSYYEQIAPNYSLFFADAAADARSELAWLKRVFAGRHVESVLDAGCGTGRHAIPLAMEGLTVTAADPSRAMLRQARLGAKHHEVGIRFVQARFDELPSTLGARYDAVLLLGNTLCNLPSLETIQEAIHSVRCLCAPNGVVIIGIKNFESICRDRPRFQGPRCVDAGGTRTVLFEVWDYDDRNLLCSVYVVKGAIGSDKWRARCAQTREYMLLPEQLAKLIHDAGFGAFRRLEHPCEARFVATSI